MNIRKITGCLLLLLCVTGAKGGDMSNSIEYTQLYLIGDATPASWDMGKAEEFSRIGYGVFEWTGQLEAGKEFKFMNTREAWHKHIVATSGGVEVTTGVTVPLAFYADWALDGSKDCKMRVAQSGTYTLTVDLNSMRMSLSDPVQDSRWPSAFYVTGSANGGNVEALRDMGVEFKGTFHLIPGFLKLVDTPTVGENTTSWLPRYPEVDLTFGGGYLSPLFPSSDNSAKGWSVMVEGDYAVYLDKNSKSYQARRLAPYTELILVGGCCERSWNYWDESNCRFLPDEDDPFVMVWEGELRIGWDRKTNADGSVTMPDEPAKFKILTARDWFRDTFHPYTADAPAVGESDARISGGDDLKWTISKDGFYRLELDIRTEVLTGTYLGENSPAMSVAPDNTAAIEVTDSDRAEGETVYYNLQGMRIESPVAGEVCIRLCDGRASKVLSR